MDINHVNLKLNLNFDVSEYFPGYHPYNTMPDRKYLHINEM